MYKLGFYFLFLLSSCYVAPTYVTRHGFNVYCENPSVCFPKQEIELATELLIDELDKQMPDLYNKDKVLERLEDQYQWHDIYIKEVEIGPEGSCATEKDPERTCKGFVCEASETGWCMGLTKSNKWRSFENVTVYFAKYSECLSATAFIHEMIHLFHRVITKTTDAYHEKKPYWAGTCYEETDLESRNMCMVNSIDRSANWELCKNICGDLCNAEEN